VHTTRYEILLPLKYNDGGEIEAEKFLLTKQELVQKFGALSVDPHPIQGLWTHQGVTYEDLLLKYVVDIESDTSEIQAFFHDFKETLKIRFRQIDIWIVATPIRVI
jgi:hypothetical protein